MRPLFMLMDAGPVDYRGEDTDERFLGSPTREKAFIKRLKEIEDFSFYISVTYRERDVSFDPFEAILLSHEKLSNGKYDFVAWNDIPPLDSNILAKMKPYEYMALKVCARMAFEAADDSFDNVMDVYFNSVRFWHHIVVTYKIDMFISNLVPMNCSSYVAYALCKSMRIPTLSMYYVTSVEGESYMAQYCLADINNHLDEANEQYLSMKRDGRVVSEDELSPIVSKYLTAYSKQKSPTPSLIDGGAYFSKRNIWKRQKNMAFLMIRQKEYKRLFLKTIMYFSKRIAVKYYRKISVVPDFSNHTRYLYMALHYQPEVSTLPLGGYFVDQELIVSMISAILPPDVFLFVKEHPLQSRNRTSDYYKKMCNYPNVKLIRREANTLTLIKNSLGVVTVTGSVGWEALFNNTPVLLFGNTFYKNAPGVFMIRTNDDCQEAIGSILKNNCSISNEELRLFLYSIQGYIMDHVLTKTNGEYQLHPAFIKSFISIKEAGSSETACHHV